MTLPAKRPDLVKSFPAPTLDSGDGAPTRGQGADQTQTLKDLDQVLGQNQNKTGQSATETVSTDGGIKGLPGIYLKNDGTGKGNNNPYGVPGLPGTYVNGPAGGSSPIQIGANQPELKAVGETAPPTQPNNGVSSPAAATGALTDEVSARPTSQPRNSHLLDNVGHPDFDGNAGGNGPIIGQSAGGQPATGIADAASAQKAVNLSGVPAAHAGLTPHQTPASGDRTGTSAGDQLLSAVAGGQNSGNNFDSGGRYAGSLNTPGVDGRGYFDASVVDLRGKAGIIAPASFSPGNSPARNIASTATPLHGLDRPPVGGINSPLTPEQLNGNAEVARGILDAMYAADCAYTSTSPSGYKIIRKYTRSDSGRDLILAGTDATLYGAVWNGKTNRLILAFRGTTQDLSALKYWGVLTDVWRLEQQLLDKNGSSEDLMKLSLKALGDYKQGIHSDGDFNISEWVAANFPNEFHGAPQRFQASIDMAINVRREFPGIPLTLSGHSLGGGEAALAAVATGLPAITFNAEGVWPADYGLPPNADTSRITNFSVLGEPLTTMQFLSSLSAKFQAIPVPSLPNALGNQIVVLPQTSPLSNVDNHSMPAVKEAVEHYLSQW